LNPPVVRGPGLVLGVCCLSLFLVTMDVTIMNVALPAIHAGLQSSIADVQWAVDGYNVVMASVLLLSGSLADRFGRKRMFQTGIAIFGIASLACSVAPSIQALILFRIVQALGGSLLTPSGMGIIVNTFTDPKERAKAIGVWGTMTGLSMSAGPLLGGLLTQTLGWRWIFAINVPIVIAAIVLSASVFSESRAPHARRFDPVGQVLAIVTLGAFVWALIYGRETHWSAIAVVAAVVAIAAAGLFVPYELRRREPLIELQFFRKLPFASASAIAVISFIAFNSFLFVATFYLQGTRGFSPLVAGLFLVPASIVMMIASPIAARLAGSGRAGLSFMLSGGAFVAGSVLLFGISPETNIAQLLTGFAFFGIGLGLSNAVITTAAVSGMPREQSGVAVGIVSSFRVVGSALGVAAAGTPALFSWWLPLGCGIGVVLFGVALERSRRLPSPYVGDGAGVAVEPR
jgi:EmrB/QacA subfamily drug resistance transporter